MALESKGITLRNIKINYPDVIERMVIVSDKAYCERSWQAWKTVQAVINAYRPKSLTALNLALESRNMNITTENISPIDPHQFIYLNDLHSNYIRIYRAGRLEDLSDKYWSKSGSKKISDIKKAVDSEVDRFLPDGPKIDSDDCPLSNYTEAHVMGKLLEGLSYIRTQSEHESYVKSCCESLAHFHSQFLDIYSQIKENN
jgi:hypothetical protein